MGMVSECGGGGGREPEGEQGTVLGDGVGMGYEDKWGEESQALHQTH